MNRQQRLALISFALGLTGLGVLTLIYDDFALIWQPVSPALPGRFAFAYASSTLLLLGGVGLLFRSCAAWSARILFPYLLVWLLLKVPALFVAPKLEAVWLGFGEIAVLFAAGWILFATIGQIGTSSVLSFTTGERAMRVASMLFGLSLIPIGLSHIVYTKQTVDLIPTWLPFRTGIAYLTGGSQICCGLAVLFSAAPRVAALIEAGMVSLFAALVWAPAVLATPSGRVPWTAFFITWLFAASAWNIGCNVPNREDHLPRSGENKVPSDSSAAASGRNRPCC